MFVVACGSEGDGDAMMEDGDAMKDDSDAMMDMDGPGFGAAFTLNGVSYSIWCPEGGSAPPILANSILANSLRLTCAEQSAGNGGLAVLLVISDVRVLDGPFQLTGPGAP